jgi:hypothetical protein
LSRNIFDNFDQFFKIKLPNDVFDLNNFQLIFSLETPKSFSVKIVIKVRQGEEVVETVTEVIDFALGKTSNMVKLDTSVKNVFDGTTSLYIDII